MITNGRNFLRAILASAMGVMAIAVPKARAAEAQFCGPICVVGCYDLDTQCAFQTDNHCLRSSEYCYLDFECTGSTLATICDP